MILCNAKMKPKDGYKPTQVFKILPVRLNTGEIAMLHYVWKYIRLWDDEGVYYEYAKEYDDIKEEFRLWRGPR